MDKIVRMITLDAEGNITRVYEYSQPEFFNKDNRLCKFASSIMKEAMLRGDRISILCGRQQTDHTMQPMKWGD